MKGLTVRQPWASLIVHGPKVIETRTRRTNVRGRVGIIAGRSLVHASGLPDEDDPAWSVDDDIAGGVLAWEGPKAKPVRAMFSYPDATMQAVSLGALIGTVELYDCVPIDGDGDLDAFVGERLGTTLFFRNYYIGLPDELIKAAQLDGAGFWMIFRRIVLPLSLPILVVTLIWQFTNIWNDFLYGVVFSGADSKPITVGLNNLANTSSAVKEYNVDMAAALIAALPTLFVYVVAGKYFVRGLTAGAVKG